MIELLINKAKFSLFLTLFNILTSIAASPSSFSVSPRNADNKEDFPLPTGPTTATRDPTGMSRLMLERLLQSIVTACLKTFMDKCHPRAPKSVKNTKQMPKSN